jgi:hypothetical protein
MTSIKEEFEDRVEWHNTWGQRHREGGPAVERKTGTKEWRINGQLHREDGPAIERADGTRQWCQNGRLHREGGPAVETAKGTKEWWINGNRISLHIADILPINDWALICTPIR